MSSQLLQGKKIIIVEDNTFLSNVISQNLTMHGARVLAYTNGLEGLAAVRAEKPDLILMDILMPVMNGYEMLQVMNSEGITESIPIIVISNSGQPVEIERIKALGVTDYLVKADFEPEEVVNRIFKVLKIAPATPAAAAVPAGPTDGSAGDAPAAVHSDGPAQPTSNGMPKVLVVEDDPLLRNLLSMKLSGASCPTEFSTDGMQAVELATMYKPDVIVLDLRLPGKDGFEVLQELKTNDAMRDIPVVVFSNNSSDEDRNRAAELGAASFHVKAMTDLDDFIKELLRVTNRQAG